MKKIKFLAPVLAMFTLLLFSSCKKDAEVYWTAIGTISDVTSPSSFVFHDDNGVVINIAKTPFVMSLEYQGKRASMTFTRTDAVVQEGDKVMNGTVVYMDFIKTKDVVSLNQYPTEEERKKELGMQYITPAKAWFGGGYLNLIYHAGFSDLNAKREISLAIDGEKSTTDNIYASLYYKADDD
ncbi:MAG: NigD-like C-terminal domain-containing protein [Rikenellaceae bacterium]